MSNCATLGSQASILIKRVIIKKTFDREVYLFTRIHRVQEHNKS